MKIKTERVCPKEMVVSFKHLSVEECEKHDRLMRKKQIECLKAIADRQEKEYIAKAI